MLAWATAGMLFTVWIFYSYQSHGVDDSLLRSTDQVTVSENSDWHLFSPVTDNNQTFLFYPGAMVDPKAYVPLCRKLADNGYRTYLLKLPYHNMGNRYNFPKELGLFSDQSTNYTLIGHSKGARMAAQFVYENPGLVRQLILIGSSHPRDISLANMNIPVLKIFGSRDGVADEKSIMQNKGNLPSSTTFQRIEGANHSQFGYYGFQLGDNPATIGREEQTNQTLQIILHWMELNSSEQSD